MARSTRIPRTTAITAVIAAGLLVGCRHVPTVEEHRANCAELFLDHGPEFEGCLRSEAAEAARIEAENSERRSAFFRSCLMICAAGAAGYAQGYTAAAPVPAYSAPDYGQTSPVAVAAPARRQRGCMTDLDCGIGKVCVMPQTSLEGYCATPVDPATGVPVVAPRLRTPLDQRARQCWTMSDCPATFSCDDGQCVRPYLGP